MLDEQHPGFRATGRHKGNRLRQAASLYLQQHAHNPVDWYPWGEEALTAARDHDRPIFLSSGYASCHWCHVMEREVFQNEKIARALNRGFVCIKVDREESPEIDAAYMQAVQLLTGAGGWPLSVFLTPDLRPFFGGTYIPPERFLELLRQIDALWRTNRAGLGHLAGQTTRRLLVEPGRLAPAHDHADRDVLVDAVRMAQEHFDEQHGGLAGPMKFPVPVRWMFLLRWWRHSGDQQALRMVIRTLEAMAAGGLRDHVGGGFHRYTVDPHWTVPHFEKMLYDNAQLASLYLEAGATLHRDDFTEVGLDTLAFMASDLSDDTGPCYASLDADSEGGEGAFYIWTRDEVVEAAGLHDGPALADLLGVCDKGNAGSGARVVTRRADPAVVAERHGRSMDEVAGLFDRHREALRRSRAGRPRPCLDRKIITAWNGLAMSAYVHGYMANGEAVWRDRAASLAAYLRRVHQPDGRSLRRASNDGLPVGEAVLEDHALLAQGLLDLHKITADDDHLTWAGDLLKTMLERFARSDGAWLATASAETPLGRRLDLFDHALPSGGSAAVNAFWSFAERTGEAQWSDLARKQLGAQIERIRRSGLEMAGWLSAALQQSRSAWQEGCCALSRTCAETPAHSGSSSWHETRNCQ